MFRGWANAVSRSAYLGLSSTDGTLPVVIKFVSRSSRRSFSRSVPFMWFLGGDTRCPSNPNSSLNLIVLVFVSGAVSLSQVDVAFSIRFSFSIRFYEFLFL